MLKYFKETFKITNENIILATPLVLFLFLLSLYLSMAKTAPQTLSSALLLLVTILFMLSAFFAGWFFMIKKAIEAARQEFIMPEDKAKASFRLMKEIPVGVGEYFLSFVGVCILYSLLFIIIIFVGYRIGAHFIGNAGVTFTQLKIALESTIAMKALIATLSTQQLAKLNAWNFLIMCTMSLYSFLTMFWGAQIVYKTKNPLIAFFESVHFTFKHLLSAFIIFIYITLINFVISLVNAFATINPIIYFISMLIYFYFVVYIVVLVFLYYERENSNKFECTTCNCVEGDGDCGTDSVGQDEFRN